MTHTFTTVKGWCCPARNYINAAFKPLGIKAKYGVTKAHKDTTGIEDADKWTPPTSQTQTVTVSDKQATWAEYVLGAVCSQSDIQITNGIKDRRNFAKGQARSGVPMPWLYKAMGSVPDDDKAACVASLPADERKLAELDQSIQRGRTLRNPTGIRFTSEPRKKTTTSPDAAPTNRQSRRERVRAKKGGHRR